MTGFLFANEARAFGNGPASRGRRIRPEHAVRTSDRRTACSRRVPRLADVAGEPRKRFTSFLRIRFERLPLAGNRHLLDYLSAAGVKAMRRQGGPCNARTVRMVASSV